MVTVEESHDRHRAPALNPIGPIMAMGAMLMATIKVHAGKPSWLGAGGAELPLTNMAVRSALILAGPGKPSVDDLLGIRIPRWFGLTALVGMLGTVAWAATSSATPPEGQPNAAEQPAGETLQGEAEEQTEPPPPVPDGDEARPGVESWGSPDPGEPAPEDQAR